MKTFIIEDHANGTYRKVTATCLEGVALNELNNHGIYVWAEGEPSVASWQEMVREIERSASVSESSNPQPGQGV